MLWLWAVGGLAIHPGDRQIRSMFRVRIYLVAMVVLALPLGGLWLHAWDIAVGLKWLEPEPNMLAIAALSVGVSALLALLVTRSLARS
jgi:hypothetical protein